MLTSLPRSRLRAKSSHICAACLFGSANFAESGSWRRPPHGALFSTASRPGAGNSSSKAESNSNSKSSSSGALDALRDSLLSVSTPVRKNQLEKAATAVGQEATNGGEGALGVTTTLENGAKAGVHDAANREENSATESEKAKPVEPGPIPGNSKTARRKARRKARLAMLKVVQLETMKLDEKPESVELPEKIDSAKKGKKAKKKSATPESEDTGTEKSKPTKKGTQKSASEAAGTEKAKKTSSKAASKSTNDSSSSSDLVRWQLVRPRTELSRSKIQANAIELGRKALQKLFENKSTTNAERSEAIRRLGAQIAGTFQSRDNSLEYALKHPRKQKERLRVPARGTVRFTNRAPLRPNASQVRDHKEEIPASVEKVSPFKGVKCEVETVSASNLKLFPIAKEQNPVPKLEYGLERVLFNPGPYHLRDPRSRVLNFDPYLQKIMPINEFDFSALKQFVTSSKDDALFDIAKQEKMKYSGSTSSTTSALAHFHFLLSQWRPITTGVLSQDFPVNHESFSAIQKGPVSVFLRLKDGVYAIDADKEYDSATVLSMLGKSMEKLLTLPKDHFEKYRKENSAQIPAEQRNESETYNYTTIGDFLMRSQLDAYDPRLPGTGMFDLKTRAVVSVRMDVKNHFLGRDYEIRGRHGEFESFEREYFDMIRSAFLKYSLQVRMGRMDGIFVAFHNTQRIFGFQYISLSEMDYALHGTTDTTLGDSEFKISMDLLNKVLDKATKKYPDTSLNLHFETRGGVTPFMYIFAEPIDDAEISKIQDQKWADILEVEAELLGRTEEDEQKRLKKQQRREWESLRPKIEKSIAEEKLDTHEARRRAEQMIETGSEFLELMTPEAKEAYIDDMIRSYHFDGKSAADGNSKVASEEDRIEEQITSGSEDELSAAHESTEDNVSAASETDNAETVAETVDKADEVNHAEGTEELTSANSPADDSIAGEIEETKETAGDNRLIEDSIEGESAEEREMRLAEAAAAAGEQIDTAAGTTSANLPSPPKKEVLGMTLTVRNKVNGNYITRPGALSSDDKWEVEYALAEIDPARAQLLYAACKTRRAGLLSEKPGGFFIPGHLKFLRGLSAKGKAFRKAEDKLDAEIGVVTLDGTLEPEKAAGNQEAGTNV